MEKEFIPHNEALALKELGFNEPCFGFYIETGEWVPASYSKNGTVYPSNKDLMLEWVTSPTWQQAFGWFIKKYNLNHWLQNGTASWVAYIGNTPGFTPYKKEIKGTNQFGGFDEPEEADLACLRELIKRVQ